MDHICFEFDYSTYLPGLETLPGELQRNFTLMKELDSRSQGKNLQIKNNSIYSISNYTDLVKKINTTSEDYVAGASDYNCREKTDKFNEITDMFSKTKEYADDKVQLAMQTYEMVDKHIRRLDSELAKLEADLKEKQLASATGKADDVKKKGRGREKKNSFNPKNVIKEDADKKKVDIVPTAADHVLIALAGSSEVLDMPVDPNEPTYCTCHQVSYGEMIGCDNSDCPIEWFHFGCVGLTAKPKGKWFCSKCQNDRKKK